MKIVGLLLKFKNTLAALSVLCGAVVYIASDLSKSPQSINLIDENGLPLTRIEKYSLKVGNKTLSQTSRRPSSKSFDKAGEESLFKGASKSGGIHGTSGKSYYSDDSKKEKVSRVGRSEKNHKNVKAQLQIEEEISGNRKPAHALKDDGLGGNNPVVFSSNTLSSDSENSKNSIEEDTSSTVNSESSNKVEASVPARIKGQVTPLSGKVVYQAPLIRKLSSSAYAAVTCTTPKIELFDILSMTVLADNPLGAKDLESDVAFEFDPVALGLDISTPTRYMLRTIGCTESYERIVTSFYSNQELSPASTLISKVVKTPLVNDIPTASAEDMEKAIAVIQSNITMDDTPEDAYNDLISNTDGQASFGKAFDGNSHSVLAEAAPEIDLITIPNSLNEKSNGTFNIQASHWLGTYAIAYQWIVEGSTESNSTTYLYAPSANAGLVTNVTLRVGRKNGGDANVDTSVPYHEFNYAISNTDIFPAIVPSITLNVGSASPSSTRNILLDMNNGADLGGGVYANCETFSNLAIVENGVTPVNGDFTYSCNTPGTQTIPYSITSPEGPVSVEVWSRDSAGRMSLLSQDTPLILDNTDPAIVFTNIVAGYRANQSHTFSWSLVEANADNSQNFSVDFYNGATWSALPNIAVTNGPHGGTIFSSTNFLANTFIANAKIRVSYTDLAARSTVVESSSFSIDKPSLGISLASHDFGSVLSKSTTAPQLFTITNSGTAAGDSCGSVALTGANASEFNLVSTTCSNNDLGVSASCTVSISAAPTSKGAKVASLGWACGPDSVSSSLSFTSSNNTPTTGANQNVAVNEDNILNISINAGSDIDLDALTYSVVTGPANGTLSACMASDTDLDCVYTPNLNFNGSDSFTYRINDGTINSSVATVSITVNPVNDQPVSPANYAIATNEDTVLNFTATLHTDVDLDTLSYSIVTAPTNGTLTNCMASDGDISCTYSPTANFNGADSFTYKSNDGALDSAIVTVTIAVNPINDGPVAAANLAISTNEDTVLNFTANSASDIDLDILFYSVVTAPTNGTLSNCMSSDADVTCTYTPNLNFYGTDTFVYRATDGSLNTANTTVTITVNPVNDAPVAGATMNLATNEDVVLNFTANVATDVDLDSLTYSVVSSPSNGALSNCMASDADVTCTYTPALNFNGVDSFTYRANDGALNSALTTVNITVNSVNDLPVVGSDMNLATNEDTLLDFNANPGTDVDPQTLTYTVVTGPSKGVLSNCMGGTIDLSCRYTPNLNENGADSFTYRVNDGIANSASVTTVNITINPINDLPLIGANQSFNVDDNININFTLNSGSDVDLDSLSYKVISAPSNGVLSNCITAGSYGTDLSCSYISNTNFHGADTFTYLVYDGTVDSSSVATVTINVSDKTPPAAPGIALHSNQYTNSTSNTLTVSSCTDFAEVLVNEGARPASGDASWVTCTTVAGGTSYTLASATEGSHTLKAWTKDAQNNVSLTSTDLNIIYDVTSPVLSLTTPALLKGGATQNLAWTVTEVNSSSSQNMSLEYYNGSSWVSIGNKALLNGPLSTTGFNYSWTIASIDSSVVKYRVNYTDLAGNSTTTESGVFTIDSTAPIINIAFNEAYKANIAQNFSWTMSELHAGAGDSFVTRYFNGSSWTTLGSVSSGAGPLSNQGYSINFNPGGTTLTAQLEVSFTDQAGNSTTAVKSLVIDGSTPTLSSFDVNDGVAVAENNNILVTTTGADASSKITYMCMRYDNSTAPTDMNDSCWSALPVGLRSTALNIQTTDSYYFRVGFVAKSYDVYAWVADAAGNISVNTNTIGVDKASVIYSPGSPPQVSDLTVANTNTPASPATLGQLQFAAGADIYVKWRAYDLEGFIASPISIFYTTDDVNYTLLQSSVPNVQGTGCTISGVETGCLKLTAAAPSSGYFKVRVVAEDTSSAETFLTSVPMNENQFRVIAGNTEKGVGGSGRSVVYRTRSSSHYDDMNSLVVTEKGDIFVRDSDVGLIWVNPATGVANELIPVTGASVGDGGPISGAQFKYIQAIVLDHDNGLLVLDSDRIRRIDMNTTPWTIDTIIGGGSSSDPGNDVAFNQIKITDYSYKFSAINPLPNGDIYFKSGSYTGTKWRHYKASNKRVYKVEVEGPGMYTDAAYSWAGKPTVSLAVAYNPLSSALEHMQISVRQNVPGNTLNRVARLDFGNGSPNTTYKAIAPFDIAGNVYASYKSGLDGYVYADSQLRREIFKYDHNTNTFIRIAGTGSYTPTPCADGTLATSCSIYLEGFHVSKKGQVFMNDHGLIRTIDDAGNIVTISGQFPSSGDGGTALSARIAGSHMINFGKSNASMDTFIIGDYISGSYREFNIGGNINYVTSGYGTTDYVFSTDPATGDIFDGTGSSVARYIRSSTSWSTIVGGGATWYHDVANADGKIGSDIKFDWYTAQILGYGNGKVMMHKSRWNGSTTSHAYVKLYDTADSYRQSHFAGQDNTDRGNLEAAGINVGTTRVPTYGGLMASQYDATLGWIFKQSNSSRMVNAHPNGTLNDYVTLPDTVYGTAMIRHGGHEKIYYCASNGKMIEYNKSTTTRTELAWGSGTMSCSFGQKKILYNNVSHSIIFIYHQNGLVGVGEFFL